jgi:mono/diheme cytochrome c family protein
MALAQQGLDALCKEANRMNRGIMVVLAVLCVVLVAFVFAGQAQKKDSAPSNGRLINSIEGPNLYRAYCASCHGVDAKGNGPMANALKVHPTDLTRISIRNNGTYPMQRVEKIISGEIATPSGHGTREMPVWGPFFSQVDNDVDLGRVRIDNLARYLRGIQMMK